MSISKSALQRSVDRSTIRSVSKLLLMTASLLFVLLLISFLPGIDRVIPSTPITFMALVGAIGTLLVVGLLYLLAPKIALLLRMGISTPESVGYHISSVGYWVIILTAILIAHRGLAGAITPIFDDLVWLYDVVFLFIAIPVLVIVTAHLYASLDPSASYLAKTITEMDQDPTDETRD